MDYSTSTLINSQQDNQKLLYETASHLLDLNIQAIPVVFLKGHKTGEDERFPVAWKNEIQQLSTKETLAEFFGRKCKDKQGVLHSANALAILTGPISNNLEMIDFDCQGKFYGEWEEMIKQRNPNLFKKLVIEQTESCGYHVYSRCSVIEPSQKLAVRYDKVTHNGLEADGNLESLYDFLGKKRKAEFNNKTKQENGM
jgi:hypothetical protein